MVDAIDIKTRQIFAQAKEQVEKNADALAHGGGSTHNPGMDIEGRVQKLEIAFIGLKGSVDNTRYVLGILVAITLGGIAFFGTQLTRIDNKIDAIPASISTEFRAMRADMAAQTSAIANSITATKQQAPQVILMQAPQPEQPPKRP
jgi:hypothetical protein